MSLTKNGRNFRSDSGKSFHEDPAYPGFAPAVAAALKSEFGGSTAAVKSVGRLTGANERTVRNWFEGKNGPSGESLVRLMRHSNVVLAAVLLAAERRDVAVAVQLGGLREHLVATLAAIDGLRPSTD